jgi:PAS domain S-box-containing protein
MKLSTRVMLAMVSLVLMTATIIGWLIYYNIEAVVQPRALAGIQARARLLALELDASVRGVRADALAFRSAVAVEGMIRASTAGGIDPKDGTTATEWRARLAKRFVAELAVKPNYHKFRIIGAAKGGWEILRVDRQGPNGATRIVPEGELQPKAQREFLQQALKLPPGGVSVSQVELEQNNGRIVLPQVPVIRASAPIHSPEGRLFGAIVIDVDLRGVFDHIRASREGSAYLVNQTGDYLVHPDREREFGFEFAKPSRVDEDFPALASALKVDPDQPRLVRNRVGEEFGVAPISFPLAQGPVVTLLLAWPYSLVMAPAISVRDSSLIATGVAVLLAFGLALILARSMTRPLVAMTNAVEAFGRGERMAAPVGAQGEFGVLASAFTRMAADVNAKTLELRRNAKTFDSIMTSMADALLVVDEAGRTVLANAACKALFGDRADVGSDDWQRTYCRFHVDEITPMAPKDAPIGRAMRGESFDALALVMRREGDTKFTHIVASGRPVRDETGQQQGAVIVYRDVTEARQIERQFRQSQRLDAVGQLTGGVAHDFNNILTVITGTVEILIDGVADRPQLQMIAGMIDDAATRGADLTRQLLAFARRQPLQPQVLDPNALIMETAKLLRPTLGEHVEIEAMLEEDVWRAIADPAQLSTALLNLAVNARDAMPTGGKLTLETANVMLDEEYARANADVRPGPYVMIVVSDSGTGIPPAVLDKVFEPFFTTKEVGKGTGLGLSMVYGFVKQSDGHIKIYSEEGHGTAIKIYLPRAEEVAAPSPESAPALVPSGDETILVVEDDRMVRQYVEAQLASLGYSTLAASSAAEALGRVDAGAKFDLLFTDVIMPGGMNGKQLADEVARRRPGTRVLFTSGYTENAVVHHGRLDAGVALLNKPYRKRELAEKVRQVLDTETV